MAPNETLLAEARKALVRSKGDARTELQRVIGEYNTAVDLANGPDPDRCRHWEAKAGEIATRLWHATERAG